MTKLPEKSEIILHLESIRNDRNLYSILSSPKSFFIFYDLANISPDFHDIYKIPEVMYFIIVDNQWMNVIFSEDSFKDIFTHAFEETIKNANWTADIWQQFQNSTTTIEQLYTQNLVSLDNDSKKILEKLIEPMLQIGGIGWLGLAIDKPLFYELAKNHNINIPTTFWETVIHPPIFSLDRNNHISNLNYLQSNPEIDWLEMARVQQYQFSTYAGIQELSVIAKVLELEYSDYNSKTIELELANYKNDLIQDQKVYQSWYNKLSEVQKSLANLIKIAIEIRDQRKTYQGKGFVVAQKHVKKLLGEYELGDIIDYHKLTVTEVMKGRDWILENLEIIEKRFEDSISINDYKNRELQTFFGNGQSVLEHYKNIYKSQNSGTLGIKGNVAFKGKAARIVRILRPGDDFSKFQVGEILVTSMTRPEFVPVMKKSVGIITDEGGITCHAAIVSRELKIPCIIGTKIATQVLKDGDLVEMDTDSGVVTILEKSK